VRDRPRDGLDAIDVRLLHRLAEEVTPDLPEVAADIRTTLDDARPRYQRLLDAG
jgi:hypothetical protein